MHPEYPPGHTLRRLIFLGIHIAFHREHQKNVRGQHSQWAETLMGCEERGQARATGHTQGCVRTTVQVQHTNIHSRKDSLGEIHQRVIIHGNGYEKVPAAEKEGWSHTGNHTE